MNFKKLALSFTLASATVLGSGAVHATCVTAGKISQVYTDGSRFFVYVIPAEFVYLVVPTYAYYFSAGVTAAGYSPLHIIHAIADAVNKNVRIKGDSIGCPTAGALRYGGVIQEVYVN